ncbi:MAG: hypothetical protein GY898_21225 [Proteobacteria bacterium]|nr:hypothetical protein [Pseudomonadota bacterium]
MLPMIISFGGIALLVTVGVLVMVARFYRKVDQGRALIVNKMKAEPEVTFTGGVVLPIIHRAEVMDISVKTIEVDRRGKEGLICQDNIRADIKVTFYVRVNKTKDDVLKVAQSVGCKRASDQATLEELFLAKFSEALKTVGKRMDFVELYTQRDDFKDRIIEVIGRDLNGYSLEDGAIDYLEQTPLESLDKHNILDAQGIRKITKITTEQNIQTEERLQEERQELVRLKVSADEKVFEQERRRADAEAKKDREIATVQARELAETEVIQAEEKRRSELARLKAQEEIEVQALNKQRQVEVADKDRERVVGIKAEQVTRDRELERISRERDVDLGDIAKEKAVEVEKKEIAEVVRQRVAVDKGVAEEEERIKDLRVVAEAKRLKDQVVIAAEGEAEQALIMSIKAAEAAEKSAEHAAKEKVVLAQADLQAADIEAKAMIRMAEGTQAEEAASGLARAKVMEAHAAALEKEGLAEAKVIREKMDAQAEGETKVGHAAAVVTEEKLAAEAAGITAKAAAMKELEGQGWQHEEFRLKLAAIKELQLEGLKIKQAVAEAQAEVLGKAFGEADIKIVGGDGAFFDKFMKSMAVGHGVDGMFEESDTLSTVFGKYLQGEGDLPGDLKDMLSGLDAGAVRDLSLAALAGKVAAGGGLPEVVSDVIEATTTQDS